MAFPTVQTADTKSGTVAVNSASWTLTYPTNIVSGDLLVAAVAADGTGSATAAGWQAHFQTNAAGAVTLTTLLRIAGGTETGTFTATISASEQGAWRIFRISSASWFAGTIPTGSAIDLSSSQRDGTGVAVASPASPSASSTPDPVVLDPSNWATEDTLWIAAIGVDTSRTISAYPLADLNTADVSGGSTGATLGICMKNDAVSSLDPGTFTISASDDWATITTAIRPAAGGAAAKSLLARRRNRSRIIR